MKVRTGFVSNSSSSSFAIKKEDLNMELREKIINHLEEGKKFELEFTGKEDEWEIYETKEYLRGSTYMDNFSMREFFGHIKIDPSTVEWEDA